jgi:putative autotransporter adhesin-like protein
MMKKVVISMFAVLSLLLLYSFMIPDTPKEDIRKLDAFSGIGISVSADVYYTPGNTHEIRIEGEARDVDDLITKVKDGFLQVKYDDWRSRRSKLTIYISSSELEAVKISGSAHFNSKEAISSDEMSLAMSGSGNILFEKLAADEVDIKISGSGDIDLFGGNADEMDVKISGSGKVNAEDFEVNEFSTGISGSGNVRVTVKEDLDAKISGSGKVYYHGSPRVNSVSSGSGKVVAL